MKKQWAAAAALSFALSAGGSASAATVTFDSLHSAVTLPALGPHYAEAGLSFDVTNSIGAPEQIGSFGYSPLPGYNELADADPVGAAIFVNAENSQITITRSGGGTFTFNAIDLTDEANGQAARRNYNLPFNYVDGGGVHSGIFALDNLAGLQHFTLDLTGVQSFTLISGALSRLGDPGVQLDNVRFDEPITQTGGVPEPAAWAMMLVGFFGMGGLLRARRTLAAG